MKAMEEAHFQVSPLVLFYFYFLPYIMFSFGSQISKLVKMPYVQISLLFISDKTTKRMSYFKNPLQSVILRNLI